ncbi:MAG: hypothetical protein KR126chlam4_00332 [Candidatus Anoxychlamydiales bacterium]|nr:hypothetical protein [Candidatus Anoxychlamydiales bacterium]
MKKIFLLVLLLPFFIFSAPSGSPSLPAIIEEGFFIPDTKWVNFRLGFLAYHALDLVMEFDEVGKDNNFHLRKVKANANLGVVTINIKDRLDLYAEIGSYKLEPEFRQGSSLYIAKSGNDILYRAGARLIFFEILDFTLGASVKYTIFSASNDYLTINDRPVDSDIKFDFKEWQIDVGLAQKISILRPYIGISYRDTQIKMKNLPFLPDKLDLTFQKKAGVFLGVAASLGSFVMVEGEIKLVNERSTTLSLDVRF